MNVLRELERWYLAQCDGDWEHVFKITIETLDNPGWVVEIPIVDTTLEYKRFEYYKREESEDNWVHAKRDESKFYVFCGPLNLEKGMKVFLEWANS